MDIVLKFFDNLILDDVWAKLVPLSAFTAIPPPESSYASSSSSATTLNNSFPIPLSFTVSSASSVWSHILSSLPHPPLPLNNLESSTSSAVSAASSLASVSAWPRDYVPRQLLSLVTITMIGIVIIYFLFAGSSYYFIFNHEMMKHPRFLKNQVKMEIQASLKAFPVMTLLTLPWFQLEVMGYSRLYDDVEQYGWGYLFFSVFFFLVFTDYFVYWVHRILHHPLLYKRLHKPHHKWIIPTPFASYAFHPVDGYMQSVPYHVFVFLFPLHRKLYLALFTFINFWTILIHDSDMITDHPLEHIINGPAHHTLHHLYFTVNYGQYFTWADRLGKSYRHPQSELDPLLEVKAAHENGHEIEMNNVEEEEVADGVRDSSVSVSVSKGVEEKEANMRKRTPGTGQ